MRKRLVIVGAGLGGCTLASAMADVFDVTVVECGAAASVAPPAVVDEGLPAITDPHVASGLGGTTSLWHNGLIEIDSAVFDRSWPIAKSQLQPYYARALPLLARGLERSVLMAAIEDLRQKHLSCGMPDGLYPGLFYPRWPVNVWDEFGLAGRVTVVAAHVSGFETDEAGRVTALKTDAGSVHGDVFVLAAGGLGTPVLLQNLAEQHSFEGAAHAGKHYEDHPMTFVAELQLDAPLYRLWNHSVPRAGGNLRLPLVVERDGLQVSFQLRPSATVSASSRRQRVDTVLNDLRRSPWNLAHYVRLLLHPDDLLDILSFKFGIRVPTRHYTLLMVAQMPTRNERDVWAAAADSERGALTFHRRWMLPDTYIDLLRSAIDDVIRQLGPLVQGVRLFDGWPATLRSAAHHSGTARMSKDPSGGVCDSDARVHGLPNLYVCDGSLIPASGIANTGLTIAALALRLADHLRHQACTAPGPNA